MVIKKKGITGPKSGGLQTKMNKGEGGLVTRDNPDDFYVRGRGRKRTILKYDNPDDVDI